jgi:hypothetical protein
MAKDKTVEGSYRPKPLIIGDSQIPKPLTKTATPKSPAKPTPKSDSKQAQAPAKPSPKHKT